MFQLMDHCTAVVSLIFLAFFEVVAVCWIFGKVLNSVQTFTFNFCLVTMSSRALLQSSLF